MGLTSKEITFQYNFAKKIFYYYQVYVNQMQTSNHYKSNSKINSSLINIFNFHVFDSIKCGFNKNLLLLRNSILNNESHEEIMQFKGFNFINSIDNSNLYNENIYLSFKYEIRKNSVFKILLIFSEYFLNKELNITKIEDSLLLNKFLKGEKFLEEKKFGKIELYNTVSIEKEIKTMELLKEFLINYNKVYVDCGFTFQNREFFLYLEVFLTILLEEEFQAISSKDIEKQELFHYFLPLKSPEKYFCKYFKDLEKKEKLI